MGGGPTQCIRFKVEGVVYVAPTPKLFQCCIIMGINKGAHTLVAKGVIRNHDINSSVFYLLSCWKSRVWVRVSMAVVIHVWALGFCSLAAHI